MLTEDNAKTHRGRYRQRLFRTRAADTLPIGLQHERIYILPTPRGLALAAVVALMLVASINYRLSLGYALSFLLIGLYCACLFACYRNLAGLQIVEITGDDTFAPGPTLFKISIANPSIGRERFSICTTSNSGDDLIDIKANQTTHALLRSADANRGLHSLGRLTISSNFPMGLWCAWGYVHAPTISYVYPAPEHPASAYPATSGNRIDCSVARFSDHNHGKSRSTGGDFESLRAWQPTDSPAAVAWKAVARGHGMFSKDFAADSDMPTLNFTWSSLPKSLTVEQRLSRMTAWIVNAETAGSRYSVEMPGFKTLRKQSTEKQTILRHLAVYQSTPSRL